jgi:hypothetical protein
MSTETKPCVLLPEARVRELIAQAKERLPAGEVAMTAELLPWAHVVTLGNQLLKMMPLIAAAEKAMRVIDNDIPHNRKVCEPGIARELRAALKSIRGK